MKKSGRALAIAIFLFVLGGVLADTLQTYTTAAMLVLAGLVMLTVAAIYALNE